MLDAARPLLTRVREKPSTVPPHAVSRLRSERLARSTRPFLARGGPQGERCAGCRLRPTHCLCALQPQRVTQAGMCLLMHDKEPIKPSNTGWLIADVVADTWAFGWSRTDVAPALRALLNDPQWQPYVVFPGEFVQPADRVRESLIAPSDGTWPLPANGVASACAPEGAAACNARAGQHDPQGPGHPTDAAGMGADSWAGPSAANGGAQTGWAAQASHGPDQAQPTTARQRPLFVLLDATWPEARKMFRKSPYLDAFPVLNLRPELVSRYRLRRSNREDHFCTAEVAAQCLGLSGDIEAAQVLDAYLDLFSHHYLRAKQRQSVDLDSAAYHRWRALAPAA